MPTPVRRSGSETPCLAPAKQALTEQVRGRGQRWLLDLACWNENCSSLQDRSRLTGRPSAAEAVESPRFPTSSGDARASDVSADPRHLVDRRHISEARSSGGQTDVQDASRSTADPVRTGRQHGSRVALMRGAACLALASLVGCASVGKKPEQPDLKPWPEIRPDFRVEWLRARMHGVLDHVRRGSRSRGHGDRATGGRFDSPAQRRALEGPRNTRDAKSVLSAGADRCPRRRLDLRTPDGSALQPRRGRRRLRHFATRSRRSLASTRRPDAGDRRFDRRVSAGKGRVRAQIHRSMARRTSPP